MTAIVSWLINIAKGIGFWFTELFREAIKFTTTVWGVIIIIAGLVYAALQDTVGAINTIIDAIGSVSTEHGTLTAGGGDVGWLLSVCNTFAPMDELFSYGGAYLVAIGAFGLYRLIKSWLPGGLAGGS